MNRQIDNTDARLLDELQRGLALVERPYAEVAARLGTSEGDVISRVARLREDGVIRQISAIFDSYTLGYTSALVALAVRPRLLDEVASVVAGLKSVSHCYARDHRLNLWFTVTVEPGLAPASVVAPLAELEGVQECLLLPAVKVFKVGVFLKMTDGEQTQTGPASGAGERRVADLSDEDRRAVRVLQKDLQAISTPFESLAQEAGMSVDELLERGQKLIEQGAMRRFAAVLRHRTAGYSANAMVCWRIEPDDIERVGQEMAKHPSVSHCYERAIYPDWQFNLYTMAHGRSEDQLGRVIGELVEIAGRVEYAVLRTTKEYKKSRVVYFV